jgi:hypothetical protein
MGVYNGIPYDAIVRNILPDHLAILPDEVGAYSVADGGGLLRNVASSLSLEDIRGQATSLLRPEPGGTGPLSGVSGGYCYVCDVYKDKIVYECGSDCYEQNYKIRNGKVSFDGGPSKVRKVTSYVAASLMRNEETQGPLKSVSKSKGYFLPKLSEMSEKMRHQQFQKVLDEHYAGVVQDGTWGGWVIDAQDDFVEYKRDGKNFKIAYTYDNDIVRFDGADGELLITEGPRSRPDKGDTENRSGKGSSNDGTISPTTLSSGEIMSRLVTQNGVKYILTPVVMGKDGKPDAQATWNEEQKGHSGLFHHGGALHDGAGDAHHGSESGKSDTQTRSLAEGARAEMEKAVSTKHGGDLSKFLSALPDDEMERIGNWALKGATEPIVHYGYEGIGDRSNAHAEKSGSSVGNRAPMQMNQFLQMCPPEFRDMVQNGLAVSQQQKQQLVRIITNAPGNSFNPKWLMQQPLRYLQSIANLAMNNGRTVQDMFNAGQQEEDMYLQRLDNQPAPPQPGYGYSGQQLPTPPEQLGYPQNRRRQTYGGQADADSMFLENGGGMEPASVFGGEQPQQFFDSNGFTVNGQMPALQPPDIDWTKDD